MISYEENDPLAWKAKVIVLRMRERFEFVFTLKALDALGETGAALLLQEAKKLCDAIGYTRGSWETLTPEEQVILAKTLLSRESFYQAAVHAYELNKTCVPAL